MKILVTYFMSFLSAMYLRFWGIVPYTLVRQNITTRDLK